MYVPGAQSPEKSKKVTLRRIYFSSQLRLQSFIAGKSERQELTELVTSIHNQEESFECIHDSAQLVSSTHGTRTPCLGNGAAHRGWVFPLY